MKKKNELKCNGWFSYILNESLDNETCILLKQRPTCLMRELSIKDMK